MKTLIVEDERMAQANLTKMLTSSFDDIEIVGYASSVKETVDWLTDPSHEVDTIFMDVELSDGDCFNIFSHCDIRANVVMTTAYDHYAIKAFEAGSIDYLLKPIDLPALERAVSRCRSRKAVPDTAAMMAAVNGTQSKERYTVRVGDRLIPLKKDEIALFHSANKSNYITTRDGISYIVDLSMDTIEESMDTQLFFRTSRGCIISRDAIRSVNRHINGRLRIVAEPEPPIDVTVARARVDDFLRWFE